MTRALIIDDEAPARAALRGLLRDHPNIALAGEADTIAEARVRLEIPDYDLVFLDVQLLGGTGFDLVPFVRSEARIIFVTAFDQHAVRAFEVNALDYLIKPARPARLAAALQRVTSPAGEAHSPPPWPRALRPDDFVHLKIGNGTTRFVALAEIATIEADENYSVAQLVDGTRHLVRRTMKAWEDALPASLFVRVHRGTIINLSHYRGSTRESYEITFLQVAGHTAPVRASFRYLPDLRTRLLALGRQL